MDVDSQRHTYYNNEQLRRTSISDSDNNYNLEDSVISGNTNNQSKIKSHRQSLIEDDPLKIEGLSTFYKTIQSGKFPHRKYSSRLSNSLSNHQSQTTEFKESAQITPKNLSPSHQQLSSSPFSNYFQGIPNPLIARKLSNSNQDFSPRCSTNRSHHFGKTNSLYKTPTQQTEEEVLQEEKKKKKQDQFQQKCQKILKEIEFRKLTFTTFGFKAQEKVEDPLLQHTINKMLNSNKNKGSMYVTDLWPDASVKSFINYSRMGQGKYIMRKIAQQAFKQSTDNHHAKPNTLTRKDEEGVYYFFKDNGGNDNRQQRQLHSVFQSKDSKYEQLINHFVPHKDETFQLNSNLYKFDPNSCKDLIKSIYSSSQQPKTTCPTQKMKNLTQIHSPDKIKNSKSKGSPRKSIHKGSISEHHITPQELRKSMTSYGDRFKFQRIDEKSLFSKKDQDLKSILQDIIIQKLKEQIDNEDTRLESLIQSKKKSDISKNVTTKVKNGKEKIMLNKKINGIFDQIHDFQKNKHYQNEKKEIEGLSRQFNYAVFRSVEQFLKHQNDADVWEHKKQQQQS